MAGPSEAAKIRIPASLADDPIVGGGFVNYNGKLWWVWYFQKGWQEFLPGWMMCVDLIDVGFRNTHASIPQQYRVLEPMYCNLSNSICGTNYKPDSPECFFIRDEDYKFQRDHGTRNDWYYDTMPPYCALK